MAKKITKMVTKGVARNLIKEIKAKYKPDFFSVKEMGGGDGEVNEIEIFFGWNIKDVGKK